MALYLGKLGRRAVGYTINSPRLNRAADKIGTSLSRLTRGRYHPGLTRVAYQIALQIQAGDKIVFSPGQVADITGRVIVAHPVLEVSQEMGEINIPPAATTPEGMSTFLRHIYLKPEWWSTTISDQFSPGQQEYILQSLNWTADRLAVKTDRANSVAIEHHPQSIRARLFTPGNTLLSTISLFYIFVLTWSPLSLASYAIIPFLLTNVLLIGLSLRTNLANYRPVFGFQGLLSKQRGSLIRLSYEGVHSGPHEYIHHLYDYGYIQNWVVAESLEELWSRDGQGPVRPLAPPDDDYELSPFEVGLSTTNLLRYITEKRLSFTFEWFGFSRSYKRGEELAGIGWQLSEKTGDPETKYRFLRQVAMNRKKQELIAALQADQVLAPFFTPSPPRAAAI